MRYTHVRPPSVRVVEAPPVLQMPRAIKGRPQGEEGSTMAQVTAGRNRKTDRKVREEVGGDQEPKKLPGSGLWSELERNRILER